MADRERLLILHDFMLTLEPERLRMRYVFSSLQRDSNCHLSPSILEDCGTAACVAGWTGYLFDRNRGAWSIADARKALGLTALESDALFCPEGYQVRSAYFTPRGAAKTIRNYLDFGLMRWSEPRVSS